MISVRRHQINRSPFKMDADNVVQAQIDNFSRPQKSKLMPIEEQKTRYNHDLNEVTNHTNHTNHANNRRKKPRRKFLRKKRRKEMKFDFDGENVIENPNYKDEYDHVKVYK